MDDTSEQDEHNLKAVLSTYWHAYGGWRAIIFSPFFWISIILAIISTHFWLTQPWWDQVLSVMPNVLGFTLGGFAIFLGFGDEKFRELISGQDEGDNSASAYMEVSATFLHFVLIQLFALLAAIIAKAVSFDTPDCLKSILGMLTWLRAPADFLGYWLFLYGLCIIAASALAIFRVSFWYDVFQTHNRKQK
ncbi:hypothetical protein [Herbaspirillum rubrisubalbicans]|uniref:Transmembrane protein n=1 Tax=Herbaspirillum rubrisubalbicans TaxID=80842 RepID=A0AAD0XF79_9BURK|nr:hypothetical protein [Herbaspirillum rubrisubalbicans]AYR22309.1 hypothetical protein RC54_00070 [Herbaspirillum rubrisubalbicans]